MVSPWSSSSLLLSSLVLVSWTASPAWSDDSTKTRPDFSGLYMSNKELPFETRPQTAEVLNLAKDSLSLIKDVVDRNKLGRVSAILKQLSKLASAAPYIGSLFSFVNMILAFFPQHDPVYEEVKAGFAKVNRKLDSLSIQLYNVATDVEWFNYASVYSQDEIRILSAWERYTEFSEMQYAPVCSSDSLDQVFIKYYDDTQVEVSVTNFYHYLLVNGTSLTGNLNNLLIKKFKCNIRDILDYNLHFNQLVLKGKTLSYNYWKLKGFDIGDEYIDMLKNVYKLQSDTVDYCLNNSLDYVRNDVVEIAKRFSPDRKQDIANEVEKFLNKKYSWYKWVVLVYDSSEEGKSITPANIIKIPVDSSTIVAVNYIQEDVREVSYGTDGTPTIHDEREAAISRCFRTSRNNTGLIECLNNNETITYNILEHEFNFTFRDNLIILFLSNTKKVSMAPKLNPYPYTQKGFWQYTQYAYIHFINVKASVCDEKCEQHGHCRRILNSNEGLCECKVGYYGENCEADYKKENHI